MAEPQYSIHSETLDEDTVRLTVSDAKGPLAWGEVLRAWSREAALCDALGQALAELPFAAFRWETPPMTSDRLDRVFECVAVDDPSLDVSPDPSPFVEHLDDERSVVRFANLGGDAVMVVPTQRTDQNAYAHLVAFLRRAPVGQQQALWREVARAMADRLGERPVWLSTAGSGVAWLHVRLDERPKYYAHAPYRDL